jgi:hypothetical protein
MTRSRFVIDVARDMSRTILELQSGRLVDDLRGNTDLHVVGIVFWGGTELPAAVLCGCSAVNLTQL